MQRWITLAIVLGSTAMASAQTGFTIRSPQSGTTVRESVKIRIPRSSIPANGYVGILVNGQFLEAVSPSTAGTFDGRDFVYTLDTKEKGIADGNLNIQAVLYGVFGDGRPERLRESSVRLKLDNRTSIRPPADGFRLRYRFQPGKIYTYNLEYKQSASIVSEAQLRMGARPPELPQGGFRARYMYAFENRYPMGSGRYEGLVRLQILPLKGQPYTELPTAFDPEPRKWTEADMYPLYMRITDTGREIFGRAPIYLEMEGSSSSNREVYLFGAFPLPVLPTTGVSIGSRWQSSFTIGTLDMGKVYSTERISVNNPARGEVVGIEYEKGRRAVKVRNSIASGGAVAAEAQTALEEFYWFDLDLGMVTRVERTYTTRTPMAGSGGSGGPGGGDQGGGPPNRAGGGTRGAAGSPGGAGAADRSTSPADLPENLRQQESEDEARGGPPRGGFGGGGRGGNQGRPGGGGRGGSSQRFVVSKVKFILTLE